MGQSSLLYVLGAFIILTYMGIRMNKGSQEAMQNSVSYYNKTYARNIATSAVDIHLKKLRDDPDMQRKEYPLSILGGQAKVEIKSYGTTDLVMNTRGIYSGDTVLIRNLLTAVMTPDSNIADGAVSITFNNRAEIHVKKNSVLDGRNHNINGNLDTLSAPAVPGLTLGSPSDRTFDIDPTVRIRGKGAIDSVAVGGYMPDRTTWINQLKTLADINITKKGDLKDYTTLGTSSAPKITYVQDYKGTTNFTKDVTGAGILIIEGDVKFNKGFTYTGLIIVLGDANMNTVTFNSKESSTTKVIGSVMVVGGDDSHRTKFSIGKDGQILYSKDALAYAQAHNTMTLLARYEITDWSE